MNEYEDEDNGTDDLDRPSRSELKREAKNLQKMGERLSALPDSTLTSLDLPDELIQSLKRIRDMRRGGGLSREKRRIGALMRQVDTSRIEQMLAQMDAEKAANARAFHRLEQLRDRILDRDDEALETLRASGGEEAAQEAKELAFRADQEMIRGQPPAAARALFRLIRKHLGD